MQKCLIALGGNFRDSLQAIHGAMAELRLFGCRDMILSSVMRTRPVGDRAGEDFLNAAAVLTTDKTPRDLLEALHAVEGTFGRVRTQHWGPRILDLDLILHGDVTSNVPQLVVPHPAMWYRRFVLDPAHEVAADMVHPILGESVMQLRQRLLERTLTLEFCVEGTTSPSLQDDEIMDRITQFCGDLQWSRVETEQPLSPYAFARIIARIENTTKLSQPVNLPGRMIAVSGENAASILLQIQHLVTAMRG